MQQQFSITGVVLPANGADRAGVKVQAFDRDMPSLERRAGSVREMLGEAITDAQGGFQINYTLGLFQDGEGTSPFRRAREKNADLSFQVFDGSGQELSIRVIEAPDREYRPDQIIFNAPTSLVLNIFLDAQPVSRISEYERLLKLIGPVIEDVPLIDLSDEDVLFLANELLLELASVQRVEWLRRSAFLAQLTNLPVEAFYGWGRKDLPAPLAELAAVPLQDVTNILEKLTGLPDERLRAALNAAIEENIIRAIFLARVDEIIRQLIRRNQVLHSVVAQLQDDETKAPLANYTVTTFDEAFDDENRGLDLTDNEGKFTFDFHVSGELLPDAAPRQFRLEILSPDNEKLPEDGRVSVDLNRPESEIVLVTVKVPRPEIAQQQEQFRAVVSEAPAELQAFLSEKHNIQTLSDIRRKGGLSQLADLPEADPLLIRQLDSLADLDRISPDTAVSKLLLENNFDSVLAIADTPHSEFVAQVTNGDGVIKEIDATRLHATATAQTRLLNNMMQGIAANNANGFKLLEAQVENAGAPLFQPSCGCSDCQSAVSPAAYLATLLDYSLKHIRKNNKEKIDLQFLVDTFHQPFIDLPSDCEAVEKQVRQVRLCIESLRSYLGVRPLPEAAKEAVLVKEEADYAFAIYSALLNKLGTSYEEIRRVRVEIPETRRALADRLGIDLTVPRADDVVDDEQLNGDELDQLFLDPGAVPPKDHLLTAAVIERIFGLADTARDPFSEGAKLGDDQSQITRWNLDNVEWNQNTDANGMVYVSLVNPGAGVFRVELHSDSARTKLVASGEIATASGTVKVVSENNSRLFGFFEIAFTVDSTSISIAAIPTFLSWKLKHLRTLWTNQDDPTDSYSDVTSPGVDSSRRLPIIDPDLIGPDDFRAPVQKLNAADPDRAFDLWLKRRAFMDKTLLGLRTDREAKGITEILSQVLGNPSPDLDGLLLALTKSGTPDEINGAKDKLTALQLTVESFTRLMSIRAKDQLAARDVRNEKVTEEEWGELYSILGQIQKAKQFDSWRTEEKGANILLGLEEFWFAVREPVEAQLPRWRASGESRQAWQQALRVRSRQPIIDPVVIGADDLRHVIPGDAAFDIWKARYEALTAIHDELKTTAEAEPDPLIAFEKIINDALALKTSDLDAIDQERRAGHSIEKRLEQQNFNNGSFNFLIRILRLVQAKQLITAAESEMVYTTLATLKIQRAWAAFNAEELKKGISLTPDFFRIAEGLSTPLPFLDPFTPPWLSARQARSDWQDTLQSRIDQQDTVTDGLRSAIGAVEEASLPSLRNALIQASDALGADIDEQAEFITARLLIDAKAGGCLMTTRVAQALETLQTLIFDLRTGQFKQLKSFALSLVSDHFDEEWKWIGSYATFRAPTFVFLYPENILQPNLLKQKTPVFDQLVKDTARLRINPQSACQQAESYAAYFLDVCSLEIEATCQASTIVTTEGCDRQSSIARSMFYMFGRAQSGKIYWSAYDPGANSSGYAQSFWREIKVFGDAKVARIIGAMPYRKAFRGAEGNLRLIQDEVLSSYIHLFCLTGDPGKEGLQLARLNLDKFGEWDVTPRLLSAPPLRFLSTLEILPVQTQSQFVRPGLVFHAFKSNQFYFRTLNTEGTDWEPSAADWSSFLNVVMLPPDDSWRRIWAVLCVNSDMWFVTSELHNYISAVVVTLNGGGKPVGLDRKLDDSADEFFGAVPGHERDTRLLAGVGANSEIYLFVKENGSTKYLHRTSPLANHPSQDALADLVQIPPHSGSGVSGQQMLAYQREKNAQAYYMYQYTESGDKLIGSATIRAVPRAEAALSVPLHMTATNLQQRRKEIVDVFALNADATSSVLTYLREAYYFVPVHLALALQSAGQYLAALDCFRTVYDYEAQAGPPNQRNIYYGLELDAKVPALPLFQEADDWLLDPLNPHLIAATRQYAYTRFTIMSLVRCLLGFADSEFTQDTGESLATARTLYLTALDLLDLPELQQKLGVCDDVIAELKIEPGKDVPPEVPAAVGQIIEDLTRQAMTRRRGGASTASSSTQFASVVKEVSSKLSAASEWDVKLAEARKVVQTAIANVPLPLATGAMLNGGASLLKEQQAQLITSLPLDDKLQQVSKTVASKVFIGVGLVDPVAKPKNGSAPPGSIEPPISPVFTPSLQFCIPPNPILKALRLQAELNLYKLRSCRNIAGLKRQLDPYAAPTDTTTGLPSIGAGGQLNVPGVATIHPSLYRYPVLIERAKQLVQLAAQIEGALLSSLVNRDENARTLLEARQQLSLTQAGVRLQDLRIGEANDGVTLADLQKERAQIQIDTYDDWLQTGANEYEKQMIDAYGVAASAQKGAADASRSIQVKQSAISSAQLAAQLVAADPTGGVLAGAAGLGNFLIDENFFSTLNDETKRAIDAAASAQIASVNAALERRQDEWQLQKLLAEQDSKIGEQQTKIANDHVQIVTQERTIASIQADSAKDTVEFLTNKFTNVELFEWMSNVLGGVYSFFLQQATAMAKLAENQLAFERQEVPPLLIKADYWDSPSNNNAPGNADGAGPDRRGLTGSARLLQDIFQLDQYAFDTNKRKLPLAKTFSLARLVPVEFERFRETGVLPFATPMELFDRGFPGHYLRLIKRVRTSVIALIPPIEGIHATLSTTGPSRVVIGGDVFQTVPIRRAPEFIALSAPNTSSGVFELESQSDMLLPFEGSGVEMSWEFNMPMAANLFDYHSIADVLITLEYSALYSVDYRQQVIQSFRPTTTADRPFSFRNQFADQWYDLHNPEQTSTPMTVRFTTLREDFPPNLEAIKIQHLFLYFSRSESAVEVSVSSSLRYTAKDEAGTVGGSATSIDGSISTRRGNAGSWTSMIGKSPVGEWELSLPNTEETIDRFRREDINDILFVITYSGRTPDWSA